MKERAGPNIKDLQAKPVNLGLITFLTDTFKTVHKSPVVE